MKVVSCQSQLSVKETTVVPKGASGKLKQSWILLMTENRQLATASARQVFVQGFRVIDGFSGYLQFRVLEDFPLVISDHDFLMVVIQDVTWIDRNFPAPSGRVDDELRYSVPGGVTA